MSGRGDEPAYPIYDWSEQIYNGTGLTIREYALIEYRKAALTAKASDPDRLAAIANMKGETRTVYEIAADQAEAYAQAMLAATEETDNG